MKAMLIWSDGTTINTHIFEDKDGKAGYELAVEHMHKEYDDHNWNNDAKEEYGAYRGDDSCVYSAEDKDNCIWQVVKLPEEKILTYPDELSQAERCELFGCLIDTVEDWLEEKGVTADIIPNDEREEEEDNEVLIYGSDYDYLADQFSRIVGIERDAESKTENKKYDIVLKEKENPDGLTKMDVNNIFNILANQEVYPLELEALKHESVAMGFITPEAANRIHFNYGFNSPLHYFIASILDDMNNESDNHEYEFEGIKIWLGR